MFLILLMYLKHNYHLNLIFNNKILKIILMNYAIHRRFITFKKIILWNIEVKILDLR